MGSLAKPKEWLGDTVLEALRQAYEYTKQTRRPDGHWCGEVKDNISFTAEYVFLYQALGLQKSLDRDALSRYMWSKQNNDGSWGMAPSHLGNVSFTVEAYFALKLLGHSPRDSKGMCQAYRYIINAGGIEKVRVFTRAYLALFGLFPWSAVPQLPVELILMPSWMPINIYRLSAWTRAVTVPLSIICHHQPIFALPNGRWENNNFLDELWLEPNKKSVSYHESILDSFWRADMTTLTFTIADKLLGTASNFIRRSVLRRLARGRARQWILSHQEPSGDWVGIFPAATLGVLACMLEGFGLEDLPVKRGLDAVERCAWEDHQGKRFGSCTSPVWDTILMSIALADSKSAWIGLEKDQGTHTQAVNWVKKRQLIGSEGDWRVYRLGLQSGAFSFEYFNSWCPDVDDTAAAVIAFLKLDSRSVSAPNVLAAVEWILGMQCRDGGWAAFDADNDSLFLNKVPFSDMNALSDPPIPDICGRVLEAYGLFLVNAIETNQYKDEPLSSLIIRIRKACQTGISWLARTQEADGSWFGRWGVNYIYGTSNVLAGLAYFHTSPLSEYVDVTNALNGRFSTAGVESLLRPAVRFLILQQNSDGGWGESIISYESSKKESGQNTHCPAPSTAAQTAWALQGLLPYLSSSHVVIENGIRYLLQHQNVTDLTSRIPPEAVQTPIQSSTTKIGQAGRTWPSDQYTGTGFPGHMYMGYPFYSHHFPMMALGRYLKAAEKDASGRET